MNNPRVILITGPAGSGKSTLAKNISENYGFNLVEEDNFWNAGLRNEEQERDVQQRVFTNLQSIVNLDKNAVLEFILYKNPPNPVTVYQGMLTDNSIPFDTIVLKPTVGDLVSNIEKRGRLHDLENMEAVRRNAENQVACLEADYIKPEWIIETSGMDASELLVKTVEILDLH